MAFKVKLRELATMHRAISVLPKLPLKASYRLRRISDLLEPELRVANEKRLEIYKEMGAYQPHTDTYKVPDDMLGELNKRITELFDIEVEIALDPVTMEMLEGADPSKAPQIEPDVLKALGPALTE